MKHTLFIVAFCSLFLVACGGESDSVTSSTTDFSACHTGTDCSATIHLSFNDVVPSRSVRVEIRDDQDNTVAKGQLECKEGACNGNVGQKNLSPGFYTLIATDSQAHILGASAIRVRPDANSMVVVRPVMTSASLGFYVGRMLKQRSGLTELDLRTKLARLTGSPESLPAFYLGLGRYVLTQNFANPATHDATLSHILSCIDTKIPPYTYMESNIVSAQTNGLAKAQSVSSVASNLDFVSKNVLGLIMDIVEGKWLKLGVDGLHFILEATGKYGPSGSSGPSVTDRLITIESQLNEVIMTLDNLSANLLSFEKKFFTDANSDQLQYVLNLENQIAGIWNTSLNLTGNSSPQCLPGGYINPPLFITDYIDQFVPFLDEKTDKPPSCVKAGFDNIYNTSTSLMLFNNTIAISGDKAASVSYNESSSLDYLLKTLKNSQIDYPDPVMLGTKDALKPSLSTQYSVYNEMLGAYVSDAQIAMNKAYLLESQTLFLNTLTDSKGSPVFAYPIAEPLSRLPMAYSNTTIDPCIGYNGTSNDNLCSLNKIFTYRTNLVNQVSLNNTMDFVHDPDVIRTYPKGPWQDSCATSVPDGKGGIKKAPWVLDYDGVNLYTICSGAVFGTNKIISTPPDCDLLANSLENYGSIVDMSKVDGVRGTGSIVYCRTSQGETKAVSHIDLTKCGKSASVESYRGYLRCKTDNYSCCGNIPNQENNDGFIQHYIHRELYPTFRIINKSSPFIEVNMIGSWQDSNSAAHGGSFLYTTSNNPDNITQWRVDKDSRRSPNNRPYDDIAKGHFEIFYDNGYIGLQSVIGDNSYINTRIVNGHQFGLTLKEKTYDSSGYVLQSIQLKCLDADYSCQNDWGNDKSHITSAIKFTDGTRVQLRSKDDQQSNDLYLTVTKTP